MPEPLEDGPVGALVGAGIGSGVGAGGAGIGSAAGPGVDPDDVHEPDAVHVYGVVSWLCEVHAHVPLNESSNDAPSFSPAQVVVTRSSRLSRVSIPESEPHTGQYDPGSVSENSPI